MLDVNPHTFMCLSHTLQILWLLSTVLTVLYPPLLFESDCYNEKAVFITIIDCYMYIQTTVADITQPMAVTWL